MNTDQKLALVTGAAGGLGAEVARRLHRQGYRLLLTDRQAQPLAELAQELAPAEAVVLDLADREALDEFLTRIKGEERLDLAFINAGIVVVGPVLEIEHEAIDLQLEVNLRSALHLIKACAHNLVAKGAGHIIATVSLGGIIAVKGNAAYTASKFGLRGFLTCLRDELSAKGVAVSGIYPSAIDTPMLRYEAENNGSPMQFLNKPQTPAQFADLFEKTQKTRNLEAYLPYSDGLSSRLIGFFPWLLAGFYPLLEKLGTKGRQRYLKSIRSSAA